MDPQIENRQSIDASMQKLNQDIDDAIENGRSLVRTLHFIHIGPFVSI